MNNTPAFPIHWENHHEGMSLRDYMAAKAMQAQLSLPETLFAISKKQITVEQICASCYEWADAMLKAKEQKIKVDMTQDEEIEFDSLKTARDSLLLTVANLRGEIETIAAKEREACAQIAEQKIDKKWVAPNSPREWWELACKNIAAAIRSRGEA